MCLIIDANVLGKVFDRNNAQHYRFVPVMKWVTAGNGSAIFGGSKYLRELGKGKYLGLFTELHKVRRAVIIDSKAVDDLARKLKVKVPEVAFDDEHIVALVALSKCCLVCTDDLASLPYLKRKDLYPKGFKVPHIYRSLEDKKHCGACSMVAICPTRMTAVRPRRKPKSRSKVEI